ncbi:hypothetical protein LCGC14_3164530 [marine sediment metagenome]|uniref:Uncharacterized protein n=1 Tax=marine sediment metagenome TaxID=412755 RepID=A0A0F8WD21_9ZZZZ
MAEETKEQENATGLFNIPRVGSHGDLNLLAKQPRDMLVWSAEGSVVVAPGERRVLRIPFNSIGAGTLVAFLLRLSYTVSAGSLVTDSTMGSISTPYVLNYGDFAEIVLVGHASTGATVQGLQVLSGSSGSIEPGAVREASEVVYLEYDARVDVDNDEVRVLPLEMPAQGYKRELMDLLAHWAGTKYGSGPGRLEAQEYLEYGSGPASIDVTLSGSTLAKLLEVLFREPGDTVWLKHVTGQGAFHLNSMFFIEGMKFVFTPGAIPQAFWHLEEA